MWLSQNIKMAKRTQEEQKGKKLDPWQEEVMKTKGNLCLRSGRQVGKSTVIGLKAARYALENSNKLVMIISKTERQAGLLFQKVLFNINQIDKKQISSGRDKTTKQLLSPTKHLINLNNGSKIYSLPAGDTGFGIMGFTIDLLIADEAAFIPEEVWNSITPALAITRGEIWLLSTPFVKEGYYYNCFNDPAFTAFHTSSEDCPRKDQVFLDNKKKTLTKAQYSQMYLGEFVDELKQFYPNDLIKELCCLQRRPNIIMGRTYDYGCDVARFDRDEFTHEIFDITNRDNIVQVENIVTRNIPIPESTRKIIELNEKYNFKNEYIDSGGMGITVCDLLREDKKNKRKVIEINNASRIYNKDEGKKKIIKEELHNHLKKLMQLNKIKFLDDDEIKASLKCVQAEHNKDTGRLIISGEEDHVVEGMIRGVWGTHEKHLKPFFF